MGASLYVGTTVRIGYFAIKRQGYTEVGNWCFYSDQHLLSFRLQSKNFGLYGREICLRHSENEEKTWQRQCAS